MTIVIRKAVKKQKTLAQIPSETDLPAVKKTQYNNIIIIRFIILYNKRGDGVKEGKAMYHFLMENFRDCWLLD